MKKWERCPYCYNPVLVGKKSRKRIRQGRAWFCRDCQVSFGIDVKI